MRFLLLLLTLPVMMFGPADVAAQCSVGLTLQQGCLDISYQGCCVNEPGKNFLYWCEDGWLCGIDCGETYSTCGWDFAEGFYNCEASGEDPSGQNPINCDGSGGNNNTNQQCGSISYQGCCNGQTLLYCDNDQLQTMDCSGNPSCGWNNTGSYYDCGTAGTPDPSGMNSLACTGGTCTPNCAGKQCGNDGCGGSCGQCAMGMYCDGNSFTCLNGSCTPNCAGKQCGGDGCGGTCGQCGPGEMCDTTDGTCFSDQPCTPTCGDAQCGNDSCGNFNGCGSCPLGMDCYDGVCMEGCDPAANCYGKECGPDGCGGECGTCLLPGYSCQDGYCTTGATCQPACDGKQCGPDGCDGSCGECPAGAQCNETGTCVDENGQIVEPTPENTITQNIQCPEGELLHQGQCVANGETNPNKTITLLNPGQGAVPSACTTGDVPGAGWAAVLLLLLSIGLVRRFS